MKKIKSIFSILVCAVLMLVSAIPAQAATNDQAVLDARNGVVKVLVYVNKQSDWSYCGSAFLINEDTVITANHLFTEVGSGETVTKVSVVAVGDVEVPAKRTTVSEERDFAVLKLDQKINGKMVLPLGTPEGFDATSNVYALGFPAVSEYTSDESINYSAEDITVTGGNVSSVAEKQNIKYIQHTAILDNGNSGGPLVYSDGTKAYVVGINVDIWSHNEYQIDVNGNIETKEVAKYYYSTHIKEILEVLDALGIEYTAAGYSSANAPATTAPATSEPASESTTAPESTPEAKPALNKNMIIGIAVAAVVVIAIIIVLIVVSSKKKNAPVPGPNGSGGFVPPVPPSNNPPQHTATGPNAGAGSEGTTVLSQNMGDANATTVLGASATAACLIRTSNNERINITKPYFKIGKDANRVDYCISGNPAVSRFHASIVSKNGQYFIVDNGTTNHTYVNESMIPSNVETQISNGAKIRLADEKFEFKI